MGHCAVRSSLCVQCVPLPNFQWIRRALFIRSAAGRRHSMSKFILVLRFL